jgi:hypothetical protein
MVRVCNVHPTPSVTDILGEHASATRNRARPLDDVMKVQHFMDARDTPQTKTEKPHEHFDVIHNKSWPTRPCQNKTSSKLLTLEQDARLLATATEEGMISKEDARTCPKRTLAITPKLPKAGFSIHQGSSFSISTSLATSPSGSGGKLLAADRGAKQSS